MYVYRWPTALARRATGGRWPGSCSSMSALMVRAWANRSLRSSVSIDAAAAGGPDEMVALLRESIERYTADNYSFEQRWAALRSARRYSEKAWADYAALGWLALRLPEDSGGLAARATATAPLME